MKGAIFALFLFCGQLYGREVSWYAGSIVLTDQHVLVGEISVQSAELIFFRDRGLVSVYPSHKILSVRYYDKDANINRKFRVIFNSKSVVPQYSLYESVVLGSFDVVRKQRGMTKDLLGSEIDDFEYFIESDGSFIPLRHFKHTLYPHMMAASQSLRQFVKTEKLDATRPADAIRIVMFYNSTIPDLSARGSR